MGNNEAKLQARKTFLDITLHSSENLSAKINFDNLFKLETTSFENIVEIMPEREIRILRDTNTENLAILIEKCILKLSFLAHIDILEDLKIDAIIESFGESMANTSGSVYETKNVARDPFAVATDTDHLTENELNSLKSSVETCKIKVADLLKIEVDNFKEILTILRILNRILPIVYEDIVGNSLKKNEGDSGNWKNGEHESNVDILFKNRLDNTVLYKQLVLRL